MALPTGLGSMAQAQVPGAPQGGLMQIGAPHFGPNAPAPDAEPVGEQPMMGEAQVSAVEKLIGQFNNEINLADDGRTNKESKWIKVEKYLAGKDVQDPPDGYEESTFFYRRLPRIVQVGKQKLFKQVCPIQGRPWEIKPSPRRQSVLDPREEERRISHLREEFEDIHEAMDLENALDDMCETAASLGSAVAYGPIQLSQPRVRWKDGAEALEPEDEKKPMWIFYDPKHVYPDPNSRKAQGLEYCYFYHVLSAHQIRSFKDDPTFIEAELSELLHDMPTGNWAGNAKKWEPAPFAQHLNNTIALNRYVVWMRIGFLTIEALEDLKEKIPAEERKGDARAMAESLWEIWFCDKHVIKVSKRKFQPKKMPVYFIPFRKDPTSIFGIGAGESALEVVEMLVNITRSIDDALADTSGFQAMIDAGAIENKDLKIRGRKTWIYRNKGASRKEGAHGNPIELFKVPSNLNELMECFKLFESMIPVATGFLEMGTGQDMGSGVRTDDMMEKVWDSLEEFIKDVVGNIDRFWWKPHLRDTFEWIKEYYGDWEENWKVEADLQVQGVRGALRRELTGRKIKDFYKDMHAFGLPKWFDEIELAKTAAEGMGLEQEKAVLTPAEYVDKMAMEAKQAEVLARAGKQPDNEQKDKERAHTSAKDSILGALTHTLTADPTSPMLPVLYEQMFKLNGEVSPRATAGLSILCKKIAALNLAQGYADQNEAQALEAPVKITNPLEVAPEARNPQAAQAAAGQGQKPKTPPNPVAPAPTEPAPPEVQP